MQPAELFQNLMDPKKGIKLAETTEWMNLLLPQNPKIQLDRPKYIDLGVDCFFEKAFGSKNPDPFNFTMTPDEELVYEALGVTFHCETHEEIFQDFIDETEFSESMALIALQKLQKEFVDLLKASRNGMKLFNENKSIDAGLLVSQFANLNLS